MTNPKWSASWPLLLLAVLALPADAAPRRRPGRVVRVERPRHLDPDPIHLCMVASMEEGKLSCWGQEPVLGSTLSLVSPAGLHGTGIVRAVAPSTMMDTCRTSTAHDVTVDVSAPPGGMPAIYALQGVALGDGVRIMPELQIASLPLRDEERPFVVLDRDGDTVADFATTAGPCPPDAETTAVSPDGRHASPFCVDYWVDDGRGYARVGRDIIYQCP